MPDNCLSILIFGWIGWPTFSIVAFPFKHASTYFCLFTYLCLSSSSLYLFFPSLPLLFIPPSSLPSLCLVSYHHFSANSPFTQITLHQHPQTPAKKNFPHFLSVSMTSTPTHSRHFSISWTLQKKWSHALSPIGQLASDLFALEHWRTPLQQLISKADNLLKSLEARVWEHSTER